MTFTIIVWISSLFLGCALFLGYILGIWKILKPKTNAVLGTVFCGFLITMVLLPLSCMESKSEDAKMRDEYGCHRKNPNYHACREKGIYW
jgi:hypothetical protein